MPVLIATKIVCLLIHKFFEYFCILNDRSVIVGFNKLTLIFNFLFALILFDGYYHVGIMLQLSDCLTLVLRRTKIIYVSFVLPEWV